MVSEMHLILLLIDKLHPCRQRLQEVIYVLKASFSLFPGLRFRRYYYGPHSEDVDRWLDTLVAAGLICEQNGTYRLTEAGKAKLQEKLKHINCPKFSDCPFNRDCLLSVGPWSVDICLTLISLIEKGLVEVE